jgi:hypothetical protein
MLVALVTAPMFHSHERDDHGNPVSLVHAHFLDSHEGESHSDDEIDASKSHHQARWIDFFTFQIPSDGFALAIEFPEGIALPLLKQSQDVILASDPRAHSPPAICLSAPRSPPAI